MAARAWWRDGVLYQIYPRSFADSDGDGIGDLRGIIDAARPPRVARRRRDLAEPESPSPNADWGYDVADYRDVAPDLGTLADLDALVARGGRARHPGAAGPRPEPHERRAPVVRRRARAAATRRTATGTCGPTRARRRAAEQLGEHLRRPGVDARRARPASTTCTTSSASSPTSTGGTRRCATSSTTILALLVRPRRRGVPHRRRATAIVKDRELRDNPPATPRTTARACSRSASAACYNAEPARGPRRPPPLARDRRRRYDPPPLLLGETLVRDLEHAAPLLRRRRRRAAPRVQLPVHRRAASRPSALRDDRRADRGAAARRRWPVWTGSNHDVVRLPTRWAGGDPSDAPASRS